MILPMQLLATWTIPHNGAQRTIELLKGDLAYLPLEHSVDILVVSAFPNDYLPTSTSLIGALGRTGLSVAQLARKKEIDSRKEFSCWLSQPIGGPFAFRRVLCIESGWRGTGPEITDDLFRALAPYLVTEYSNASIAMPLIGTGAQGWSPAAMLESILLTAISWIDRGLAIRVLKIVIFSGISDKAAKDIFTEIQSKRHAEELRQNINCVKTEAENVAGRYDLFISYSHQDWEFARQTVEKVTNACPNVRVFCDRKTLKRGGSWLTQVAESLDNARRVAALYTPYYWSSPSCKDEFTAALARQNDMGIPVLFPIYIMSAPIPYLFRNLHYADCREGNAAKLSDACFELSSCLLQ
jgi:TIR domain